MSKITFNIDKRQAVEGEYINVSWDCPNPDMVSLTVEDGVRSLYQLSDSGTRSIPVTGNADKITLTLRATIGGKVEEKTATVKVKRKVLKADKVYGSARSTGTSRNSGTSGHSGSSGRSWFSGHSGPFGTSGSSGTTGSFRNSGSDGTSGRSWFSGNSGPSGTTGSFRNSGSNGSSGRSWFSGNSGSFGNFRNPFDMGRIRSWWNRVTSRFKLAWTYMPENKKMAYKILGLILAALFLANLSPRLLSLGFFIVVGYLMWIILKK